MNSLKKIGIALLLFLAIVGAGNAIGWLIYNHTWVGLAGALVVIAFAVPKWIELARSLTE